MTWTFLRVWPIVKNIFTINFWSIYNNILVLENLMKINV